MCIGGRTIESLIKPHGAKQRLASVKVPGVFREALLFESVPRVWLVIDKALPAFIGPGGRAEPNKRKSIHPLRVAQHSGPENPMRESGMKSASGYRAHRV